MSYRNGGRGDSAAIAGWVSDFRLALSFLTRLPLAPAAAEPGGLARAMRAFPLAGALIGLVCGLVLVVASALGLPAMVSALVAVAAGVLFTGALHEDGLADMADGLGARTREDALAVMRDSRIGSFGVIALVLGLMLKATALAAVAGGPGGAWAGLAALVASGAWSRAVLPALLHALPPARGDGLALMAGAPERAVVAQAAILAWFVGLAALWPWSVLLGAIGLPFATALTGLAVGALADRRLGGQTGDVAGAMQVTGEVACLVLCAALLAA